MSILMDKLYDTGMTAQGLWPFLKGFLRRVRQKAVADRHLGVHQAHLLERKEAQPQSRNRVTSGTYLCAVAYETEKALLKG